MFECRNSMTRREDLTNVSSHRYIGFFTENVVEKRYVNVGQFNL